MPIINQVVAGSGGGSTVTEPYLEYEVDTNGVLQHSTTTSRIVDLRGATDLGTRMLQSAYENNTHISGVVDFSSLTGLSGASAMYSAFKGCTGITKADLSGLQTITGTYGLQNAFSGSGVTTADLSSLTELTTTSCLAGSFQDCTNLISVDLSSLTAIGKSNTAHQYAMNYTFAGCTNLTTVNLSSLTSIYGYANTNILGYTFQNCTSLTSMDLSSLQTIAGPGSSNSALSYTFQNCTELVSVDMSGLKTINNTGTLFVFDGCSKLKNISLSSLETITGGQYAQTLSVTFNNCIALETMQFQSLKNLTAGIAFNATFQGCSTLSSLWFYALTPTSFGSYTNQFNSMLRSCSNVTVHFPMAIQTTIGSWSDVTNGFSGTNTTVLFDIVTTLTGADGNTYTRQEKDSTTTATAWVYNDTLYYTSGVSDNAHGVNEPSVSDAIYSDAACTQSVTTITAIS